MITKYSRTKEAKDGTLFISWGKWVHMRYRGRRKYRVIEDMYDKNGDLEGVKVVLRSNDDY